MKNIFAPGVFRKLTLLERILHSFATFGAPVAILSYLFIDRNEVGWFWGILISIFGAGAAIFFALLEHMFFAVTRKTRNKGKSPS